MVQMFSWLCCVKLLSYEDTGSRVCELMYLRTFEIARLLNQNHEITDARDYEITKLRNCKITKLQSYKVLTITKGISQQPQRAGIGSSHILPQTPDNQETSKDP